MSLDIQTTPIAQLPAIDVAQLIARRGLTIPPQLEAAFLARDAATAGLEQLLGGAVCLTTGQQPGLFTGPLFTMYKGVAVAAAAGQLARRLGRPVVPVFWVAGDDHDLAEANHVHLLTVDNAIERVVLRERDQDAPLTPLYREVLGPSIADALGRLAAASPDTEFRADILSWLERSYTAERDFATAFAEATAELLGPLGVVVFRPTHEAAKRAMVPHLLAALEAAEALNQSLAMRAGELDQAPVSVGDGATLVMLEGAAGRDRLVLAEGGYQSRRAGQLFSLEDLRAIGANDPQRLSPNVLLRPAIEAALLPTLGYVAGPGELAYLPQCAPIYEALGIAPQAVLPRWSGRVVESRVVKVLQKYGLSADALDAPEGQLEAALVRDDMPADASEALAALRQSLEQEYGRLERATVEIDPTLRKTIQNARNSAFKEVDAVERRLVGHLKKQNEIVVLQIAKARVNLFPLGKPQERVLTIAPYLIRYGRSFLDDVAVRAAAYYAPLGDD